MAFNVSFVGKYNKDSNYYVRCVRGSALYHTTGTLTSTNLLAGKTVFSIDSFFASTTIPAETSLWVQFSQDNTNWYSASGVLNATTSLSNDSNNIDLSGLGWTGANFYYKMTFNSNSAQGAIPVLDEIRVDYKGDEGAALAIQFPSGNVGIGTMNPASGYKLDVEGKVQATAFDTGDIIFRDQETQQILWRMFEDEDGLYLKNEKTGKVYRFLLEEVDKSTEK